MAKDVYLSSGFTSREKALEEALKRKGTRKYQGMKVTVPKRRIEGYYRIRYEITSVKKARKAILGKRS